MTDTELPGEENDTALLRRFHLAGEEEAFTCLVRKWLPLLEACARRMTGDAELSRDAVQRVFAQLARKSGSLAAAGRSPVPWLHKAVTLECRSLLRRERTHRETVRRMAAESGGRLVLNAEPAGELWREAAPHLDVAINDLPAAERRLVLARFFEKRGWREIGEETGRSADAARMALAPALEKLARSLRARGVTAGAAAVAVLLGGLPAQASASPARVAEIVRRSLPVRGPLGGGLFRGPRMAAAAAFLVTAPIGWLAFPPPPAETRAASRVSPAAAPRAGRSHASPENPTPFNLQALLADLRKLAPSGNDPGEIARLRGLLIDLPADAVPTVFEAMLSLRWSTDTNLVAEAFFARWAELDPAAAFDGSKTDALTGAAKSALRAILESPVLPARLGVQCLARLGDTNPIPLQTLADRLASQDWRSLAGTWEKPEEARCYHKAVLRFADLSQPENVALLLPGALADRHVLRTFSARWAATDEPAALAWLDSLPAGTYQHDEPAVAIAGEIAKAQPGKAVNLIAGVPFSERYQSEIGSIWGAWGRADPVAAKLALSQHGYPEPVRRVLEKSMP